MPVGADEDALLRRAVTLGGIVAAPILSKSTTDEAVRTSATHVPPVLRPGGERSFQPGPPAPPLYQPPPPPPRRQAPPWREPAHQPRQELPQASEQIVHAQAGLLAQRIERIAAERIRQILGRDVLVRAGADPGLRDAAMSAVLQFFYDVPEAAAQHAARPSAAEHTAQS